MKAFICAALVVSGSAFAEPEACYQAAWLSSTPGIWRGF